MDERMIGCLACPCRRICTALRRTLFSLLMFILFRFVESARIFVFTAFKTRLVTMVTTEMDLFSLWLQCFSYEERNWRGWEQDKLFSLQEEHFVYLPFLLTSRCWDGERNRWTHVGLLAMDALYWKWHQSLEPYFTGQKLD